MVDTYQQDLSKVVVLGGGNTGWTTALYIKDRYPESNVTVLASSEIGTVGVGEGTTPNYFHLLQSLGFSERTLFKELKATKKTGIKFNKWDKTTLGTYYHNFSDMMGNYGYAIHLDTNATTNFLMKEGIKRGIKHIDAKYLTHLNNRDLHINKIITDKGDIECTFVFDCSGFKRVLIGNYEDNKWNSYTDYLKVNEGVTFTLPEKPYEEVTYAIAAKYGWMFEIPTQEKIAGGYLFNNEYIDSKKAWQEVLELYPEATLGRNIKFNAGSYEKVYMHNVLGVGLSAGFLEPLEATSLMTVAYQLENWGPGVSYKSYNDKIKRLNRENMLFVYYHYMGKRNDTGFWNDYQKNVPEDLKTILDKNNRVEVKDKDKDWDEFVRNLQAFHWGSWSIISEGISGKKLT
jgi:tryptophan halogenase